VTQEDIDALERDLAHIGDGQARDDLLAMLMEGLVERCFPEDPAKANPVVRDEFSRRCLERVLEVATEIGERPDHPDHGRSLFVSGKAAIALQRPQEGGELLLRFLDGYPDEPEAPLAHYSLAEMACEAGDHDGASHHYGLAAERLEGAAAAVALYRLAWSIDRSGGGEGIDALVRLLTEVEGLDGEMRGTARGDLVTMLVKAGDASRTLGASRAVDGAPALAGSVAGALMNAGRYEVAAEHFEQMLLQWPDHDDGSSWQVACVDAALASEEWPRAERSVRRLMERFGAPEDHSSDRRSLQVEETSRSTVARLHQNFTDTGTPDREVVEELYRMYLDRFPRSSRAPEVRLALAALLQQCSRPLDAVDEMIAVSEAQGGREIGARAARLAAARIEEGRSSGDRAPYEDRLIRLAELFARHYSRHSDGAAYARDAGRILILRGELDDGCRVLVEGATRLPASAEARQCAATAMEALVAAEAWEEVVEVASELLEHRQLMAAHADLGDVLVRARANARFNLASQVWEGGDPGTAATLFEQLATEIPDGEVAPGALVNAAICMQESGGGSRPAMLLRRVYTRYPYSGMAPVAMQQEAYLRFEAGEFTRAAELFVQLARTFPDHENAPYALYTAGALFDQEGLFDRAIECYESFLGAYPGAPEAADARPRLEELRAGE